MSDEPIKSGTGSKLDARTPSGPLAQKWSTCKNESKLVNPADKR